MSNAAQALATPVRLDVRPVAGRIGAEIRGVTLSGELDAATVEAIAESALERKIGARGLRMIIEDLMLDIMYTLPGQKKIRECVITREVVLSKEEPITVIEKAG